MQIMFGLLAKGIGALTGAAAEGGTLLAAGETAAQTVTLSQILQGGFTVLSAASSIAAGAADADAMSAQAEDALAEIPLENLQGINRRNSIRAQMAEAIGAQDVAYAASGVDLSFGTARQARKDSYREADFALTNDQAVQTTRTSRLQLRAAEYRKAAKRARWGGLVDAGATLFKGFGEIAGRR